MKTLFFIDRRANENDQFLNTTMKYLILHC